MLNSGASAVAQLPALSTPPLRRAFRLSCYVVLMAQGTDQPL